MHRQGYLPGSGTPSNRSSVLCFILAGGRGTRLADLTNWRVKPAVPFGGKYRLIDFTLSNCINSGIRRIAVLTQYKSQSLLRHINQGWSFLNPEFGEFIEAIPAQQRNRNEWYRGTADAVFQNIDFIMRYNPELVLILSGDHIYKMDYNHILQYHQKRNADVTIASVEIPDHQRSAFGIVNTDEDGRVTGFEEKPCCEYPVAKKTGCLASMGIYVFKTEYLTNILTDNAASRTSTHDFGRDIFPRSSINDRVFTWVFRDGNKKPGYWRDVGTVDSYWHANMDLISVSPEFNLYDHNWPLRSSLSQLPPAKFVFNMDGRRGMAVDSLVSEGSIISGAYVNDSLISTNVYIMDSRVHNSIILPDVEIHKHSVIRNCIIDKYCVIPEETIIGENQEEDKKWFYVSPEGITLVTPEMLMTRQTECHLSDIQYLAKRLKLSPYLKGL